ncbi:hypothetical protein KSS87_013967 [Heliosperma pusillum]|nr:hypothetical protein KSS87_013967 [Heliosperma pusillum]
MKHSHFIISSCFILSTFLIAATTRCSQSPASTVTSSGYNNILERSPRRALRVIPSQEQDNARATDSEDKQQHSIDNAGYKRKPQMEIADDAVDNEELVYHIDYHGVTTHPAPTPKHPGHSK